MPPPLRRPPSPSVQFRAPVKARGRRRDAADAGPQLENAPVLLHTICVRTKRPGKFGVALSQAECACTQGGRCLIPRKAASPLDYRLRSSRDQCGP